MLSHIEEECLNHQAAIDSLYEGNSSSDTSKSTVTRLPERFRDMTTASIVTLVRSIASQQNGGSSPSLHSCTKRLRPRLGSLDTRPMPAPMMSPQNRLDLLASTADAMKGIQTLQRCSPVKRSTNSVKHTLGCPSTRLNRPSPLGPPPRLPSLKPWQTVKRPTRGLQVPNHKLRPITTMIAVVEPE